MKHLYSAGIITYMIKNREINYLLLHYPAGHWDFPKGKIEKGETKQEAALRELQEETGLTAQLDSNFEATFSYIFRDTEKELTQKTVYFFIGHATHDLVKLSYEHIGYQWLPYKEAHEQLTYNNAQDTLKKTHTYLLSKLNC